MRTRIVFLYVFTSFFMLVMNEAPANGDVYRWVDENGTVHFESRAPDQVDAEKITTQPIRSSNYPDVTDTPGEEPGQEPEASYAQQRRDERAKNREAAREKERLTTAACEHSREVVARLEPMTRVLVQQEDGTVIRMDDNDRIDRLTEEKAYLAKNCNK